MAADAITIDIETAFKAIGAVIDAAEDLTPILKDIGEYETGSTKERFRLGRDPDGNAWAPLNPIYALTKKGPSILVGQTRDLSSIIWQLASGTAVDIGSTAPYARIHNQGGVIVPKSASALVFEMGGHVFKLKKVKIPKRAFLGINDDDSQAIDEIITDHLSETLEQSSQPQ